MFGSSFLQGPKVIPRRGAVRSLIIALTGKQIKRSKGQADFECGISIRDLPKIKSKDPPRSLSKQSVG